MASGIDIFSDIRNNYFKLSIKKLFWITKNTYVFRIPKIVILDIKNNNVGYQNINIYFVYPKLLFWISEIIILLQCALSLAAQYIVVGPVCLCVGLCVCLFVGLLPR